jgi:hypothetical protein
MTWGIGKCEAESVMATRTICWWKFVWRRHSVRCGDHREVGNELTTQSEQLPVSIRSQKSDFLDSWANPINYPYEALKK